MNKKDTEKNASAGSNNEYENPISLMLGLLMFREKTPAGKLFGCLILIVIIYAVISTGYLFIDVIKSTAEQSNR